MRISLEALITLDAIDRRGSFAAAAEELHRVPSALSYTIQKLEDELGVKIFDRSGHRARLTEVGRSLLEDGRQLLDHAERIENRVRQLATGWESEVVIAVDDLVGTEAIFPVLEEFYETGAPTRIKVLAEVLGGCWDALLMRRADLVVGAPGETPGGAGLVIRKMGSVDFVFVVAAHHPLARAPEPLKPHQIATHRAVAVADSSRNAPSQTVGILAGQEVLTLPTLRAKLAAQVAGVGVGYLPRPLAQPEIDRGTLVEKAVEEPRAGVSLHVAWHSQQRSKAIAWLAERLSTLAISGVDRSTRDDRAVLPPPPQLSPALAG